MAAHPNFLQIQARVTLLVDCEAFYSQKELEKSTSVRAQRHLGSARTHWGPDKGARDHSKEALRNKKQKQKKQTVGWGEQRTSLAKFCVQKDQRAGFEDALDDLLAARCPHHAWERVEACSLR